MTKFRVRADQKGLIFPKKTKVKGKPLKKARRPEDVLQNQVNQYLDYASIPYLRIPDAVWNGVLNNPTIHPSVKKAMSLALAGWADNILFLRISDRFCLACMVENKSDVGKLHGKQKLMAKELPYNICRTFEEFEAVVKVFMRTAEELEKLLTN